MSGLHEGRTAVAVAVLLLAPLPACTASPLPPVPPSIQKLFGWGGSRDSLMRRARAFVELCGARSFDEAASWLDDTMRGERSPAKLSAAWNRITAESGPLVSPGETSLWTSGARQVVRVGAVFARGTVDVTIAFDGRGRIAGLWFGELRPR